MSSFYMRYPEGRIKALTFSYDDGVESDIRLIEIMRAHGLKGTFNINSGLFAPEGTVYPKGTIHRRMSEQECYRAYHESGMEVAIHGECHPFLDSMPQHLALRDIARDREELETLFGTIIRGAAYPYGAYSQKVIDCLCACGIVYCRAVACTHNFRMPTDWHRLSATCHHADKQLMELADKFLAISDTSPTTSLFYVWGHSYEFDRDDNWDVIEAFAQKMGGHQDIWYATNIEIYDYIKAYESLHISFDGNRVHNPTAQTVWFQKDGTTYSIAPGETLCLSR